MPRADESRRTLALDADAARVLALLSVAAGQPASPAILAPIAAAAGHWRRGDKALAQLRLAVAGLPGRATPASADHLRQAAALLDDGLPPRTLMKALGFDASALDKYDPNQPRVPGGSGRASGQWTSGAGDGAAAVSTVTVHTPQSGLPIVSIATDGPTRPGGLVVVPHTGVDPLDPMDLNGPVSPAEQQAISDTVNMILAGKPEDLRTLNPHHYGNDPDDGR